MVENAGVTKAIAALRQGEVIAYPTEAVYGLGCDPDNANAVAKILQLKQRSIAQGFILVADSWEQIEPWIEPVEPNKLYNVLASWPGPFTWVFPAKPDVPQWVRGNHTGLAVRVSAHPTVKMLCQQFGKPIISTSANLHGQPPIRDADLIKMIFGDQLGAIVEGKVGDQIRPTTIRDAVTGEVIR